MFINSVVLLYVPDHRNNTDIGELNFKLVSLQYVPNHG